MGEGQNAELKTRKFTTRNGVKLKFTELGFGTAPLGNLYRALTEREARLTLDAAWDVGCRVFDTAPLYGLGLAETRLNGFLRDKPRAAYLLSSKVGRLLHACAPAQRSGVGKFFETPARREIFDYGHDGVIRSLEFSLERLGVDYLDIVFAHGLDVFTHGDAASCDARMREFMAGGYHALAHLRDLGVIKAIGVGVSEWQVAEALARSGDFDLFLLAGRYTLLEQEALNTFLPYCVENKIGVMLGAPFNTGILATGPRPGAFYNYARAPKAIRDKVKQIEEICLMHDVSLAEAAIRFPLGHSNVVSVIPGAQKPMEVRRNAQMIARRIPHALWRELKHEKLMHADAPVPR